MPQTGQQSYPESPLPPQHQPKPGLEKDMTPRPQYKAPEYRGSEKLQGKVALITGGDSGIGRSVAVLYAKEGADIAIVYLPEEQPDAEETKQAVEAEGCRCLLIPGDVSKSDFCQTAIEKTVNKFGKLDILVNNAAFQMTHENITELSSEEFDYTFKTNIYAMFYLCKAALPRMEAGSTIINVASIQAYNPSPNLLAYASTKGAIVTFSKALSQEALQKGVRVNVVAPGPVWTPLIPATMPDEKVKNFGQDTPIGRPAQPAELAPLFVFLASQESSYISGEVVGVTGGKPLP